MGLRDNRPHEGKRQLPAAWAADSSALGGGRARARHATQGDVPAAPRGAHEGRRTHEGRKGPHLAPAGVLQRCR